MSFLLLLEVLFDERGEALDPLGDELIIDPAEREAHVVGALTVGEEWSAGDYRDTLFDRLPGEIGRIDALGQGQPGEEPTLGLRPSNAVGHVRPERVDHQ